MESKTFDKAFLGIAVVVIITIFSTYLNRDKIWPDPEPFKPGTCVDELTWVGESRTLHGEMYYVVIEKSLYDNDYVVEMRSTFDDEVDMRSISLNRYTWIKCPEKK